MTEGDRSADGLDAEAAAKEALIRDLVEWVAERPRAYADVMEAWRTSCPRLTVWEDAVDRGLVIHKPTPGGPRVVEATARGRDYLGGRA